MTSTTTCCEHDEATKIKGCFAPEDPAEGCQEHPAHAVLQDVNGLDGCIAWLHPHQGWQHYDSGLGNHIGSHTPLELLHQPYFASELHLVLNGLRLVSVLICNATVQRGQLWCTKDCNWNGFMSWTCLPMLLKKEHAIQWTCKIRLAAVQVADMRS